MSKSLVEITRTLSRNVSRLQFSPPVTYCYNPLEYAKQPGEEYLLRFGNGKKEVLLVGMNPGPFGMVQTGVPFGDVKKIRDWMEISSSVSQPKQQHPKRKIAGFACERKEVSGERLWTWAEDRFGSPAKFFERFFVWNYCPLCFLEESGRNRTPDKLPVAERDALFASCDQALREVTETLQPKYVIGIGAFALGRVRVALKDFDVETGTILHPSPASPIANRGWQPQAEKQLRELGIQL